jgi:DNA ligase (NAD+)
VGEKSIDNLLAEIETPQVAAGARHPGLGNWTGWLAHRRAFGGTLRLDGRRDESSAEQLQEVNDVGPSVSASIREFLTSRTIASWWSGCGRFEIYRRKKQRGTALAGKTFVLTGTLPNYSRDAAKKMIEDAGGKRCQGRSVKRRTM